MMQWFQVEDIDQLDTPGLLFFPERISQNISQTIKLAGGAGKLWPHVKTYKTPEIVRMQMMAGIMRFKCATISEAEMVASCNPKEILLAYPIKGTSVRRFLRLVEAFSEIEWGVLVDNEIGLEEFKASKHIKAFIDLDVGMHRTGISPDQVSDLADKIREAGLTYGGLHAYDGHIHDADEAVRRRRCEEVDHVVRSVVDALAVKQLDGPVIGGGSPTFSLHTDTFDFVSPGTTPLWDAGYAKNFPEMPFEPAAILVSRVISKPESDLLTLDAGYKSLASEMSHPRIVFPQLNDMEVTNHSEEHLVIRTGEADSFQVGDLLYGIPWHICPTVALHDSAFIVESNQITGTWEIEARKRKITY